MKAKAICYSAMLYLYGTLLTGLVAQAEIITPDRRHAISLYGKPKYGADFQHFDYVNPDAPKGGSLRQSVIGQFDTFMPYVDRGTAAAGSDLLYDSLLQRSWDEPLTKYGLIAERIELDPQHWWVTYYINKKARFHDGKPVTAHDVKYTFDTLRAKGSTFYRFFYRDVKQAKVLSNHKIQFTFNTNNNRELPLILGQMPVLPMHYWKDKDLSSPGLNPPVGSGPYKVKKMDPGRSVTYARDPNYWGKDLAVNKGRFNFDTLGYTYYLDNTVALEALLDGEYDMKLITEPKVWSTQLPLEKLSKKHLVKTRLPNGNPQTLTLTYNTRVKSLEDKRIREAIAYSIDFTHLNKNQFFSMYKRASSFFAGTEMAAHGLPTPEEFQWLNPWKKELPAQLFTSPFKVPEGQIGNGDRKSLRQALKLLKEIGWSIKNNHLVNKSGEKLQLTALVNSTESERIMLSLRDNLKNMGITLHVQTVDSSQYIERIRNLDFELILYTYRHTPSPGTEQASFWGSETAKLRGTRNLTGASLPVLDQLTSVIPSAHSRQELLTMLHAMDRVLLWGYYALPLWYDPNWNLVLSDRIKMPKHPAPYNITLDAWWSETP